MRTVFVVLAYLLTLVAMVVVAFFAVIFLAGPHGGLLPSFFEKPVLAIAWIVVLVLPLLVARRVWRRTGKD